MASNRTVYHVTPDASGEKWVISQEKGGFREEHRTKEEAVEAAKEHARNRQAAHVKVHKSDGQHGV
jgi:hypothetical protein